MFTPPSPSPRIVVSYFLIYYARKGFPFVCLVRGKISKKRSSWQLRRRSRGKCLHLKSPRVMASSICSKHISGMSHTKASNLTQILFYLSLSNFWFLLSFISKSSEPPILLGSHTNVEKRSVNGCEGDYHLPQEKKIPREPSLRDRTKIMTDLMTDSLLRHMHHVNWNSINYCVTSLCRGTSPFQNRK